MRSASHLLTAVLQDATTWWPVPAATKLTGFRSLRWSTEEAAEYRWTLLRPLLERAYRHSPHYRDVLHAQGLSLNSIRSLDEFEAVFPLLERDVLRSRGHELTCTDVSSSAAWLQTSGSTGAPVRVAVPSRLPHEFAVMDRIALDLIGVKPGWKVLQLWGRPLGGLSFVVHRLRRFAYASMAHMSREERRRLTEFVRVWRPQFLFGYLDAVLHLVDCFEEFGVDPPEVPVIRTHTARLYPHMRRRIAETFNAEVHDYYGSVEVPRIAAECRAREGLHVFAPYRNVEIVPTGPCRLGDVIVTDLLNGTMPLLRYRNGDVAEWLAGRCPCGLNWPRIRLEGRSIDVIRLPDGSVMTSNFFESLLAPAPISKFLVHQRSHALIDILVVPAAGFRTEDGDRLAHLASSETGARCRTIVVSELDTSIAGKHRLVRSDVGAATSKAP